MKHKKTKHRDAKAHNETEQKPSGEFAASHYIRRFETPERFCEVIIAVCAFLVSAMSAFGSHKLLITWTTGIGICAVVLAICFWLTDRELQRRDSEQSAKSGNTRAETNAVRREQRARVTPIAFGGEPKAGEPFTAFVRYKNSGKTFAKHVRAVVFAYGIKKGEQPNTSIVENEPSEGGGDSVMAPDGELTSYHMHNKGTPLTANDVALVDQGEVVIYFFGKIHYRDEFNCEHWTTFCVFFDPRMKRYSDYGEYNDTDDNC